MLFWIEKSKEITYDEFIQDINSNDDFSYLPIYSKIVSLFRNLLEGVVLYDYDAIIQYLNQNSYKLKFELNTSGTTSNPKRVSVKLDVCIRNVKKDDASKVWGVCYPPTSFAFTQVLFQALFNKQTIVNCYSEDFVTIPQTLKKYRITNLTCTPSFLNLLMISSDVKKDVGSVKTVTLGGEILNQKTYSLIKSNFKNAKLINIYASTEAGSLLYSNSYFFEIKEKLKDKIVIMNNELFIHKSMMNNVSEKLVNDFYPTGDLIEFIDSTKFYFVSRKASFINVGGVRINPIEIEELIKTSVKEVGDVRVYSKPNSIFGSILIADIICKELNEIQLRKKIKDKLPKNKRPHKVNVVDQITLTQTGKKIRR